MKRVLTIAGSDSGGGAGIQADLKTFCAFGVFGMCAVTSVTAQNTCQVKAVFDLPPDMVSSQIEVVMSDIGVDAVKIGMLSNSVIIQAVAHTFDKYPVEKLVIDPVMIAKSGDRLIKEEAVTTLVENLFPRALLVTPNLDEASLLSGLAVRSLEDMKTAAQKIKELGPRFVLVKGGHLPGEELVDVLFDGQKFFLYPGKRVFTKNTHGTGCSYSSAIASLLAWEKSVPEAVKEAREYMSLLVVHSLSLGKGHGPVNHLAPVFLKEGLDPQVGGRLW
ncbi:MAG: hydroxymethylpyrimidine/phosphomethylpyrimidine kinase [Candidatus Atribacteria bacterium]|nr:hydroxymethylpyrimidine/phosphomethylpyrimidine kinase [Candidatus Atribacteria bacterium]